MTRAEKLTAIRNFEHTLLARRYFPATTASTASRPVPSRITDVDVVDRLLLSVELRDGGDPWAYLLSEANERRYKKVAHAFELIGYLMFMEDSRAPFKASPFRSPREILLALYNRRTQMDKSTFRIVQVATDKVIRNLPGSHHRIILFCRFVSPT